MNKVLILIMISSVCLTKTLARSKIDSKEFSAQTEFDGKISNTLKSYLLSLSNKVVHVWQYFTLAIQQTSMVSVHKNQSRFRLRPKLLNLKFAFL